MTAVQAAPGDGERELKLPCLDFGSFTLPFPERGHSSFVSVENLAEVLPKAAANMKGLWLFRAESGVCGVAGCRTRLTREGVGVGMAILHHGQKIALDGKEARFFEVRRVVVAEDSHLLGRACAFCRTPHTFGDTVFRCPLCGAGYCADCWKELAHRRCCWRNCRFSPAPLPEAGN